MNAIPHASIWFTPRANRAFGKDLVLQRVERETGMSLSDLRSVRRWMGLAYARQMAMYELRVCLGLSYPRIGKILNRDHSTVIYGAREHAKRNGLEAPR